MEDLISLDKVNSHTEIIDHIFDIRPSSRDKRWEDILNINANQFLDKVNSEESYTQANFNRIKRLVESNYLNRNEIFLIKVNEFNLNHFKKCFTALKNSPLKCAEELNKVIRKNPSYDLFPEAKASLGILLKTHLPSTNLFNYIKDTLPRTSALKICQDPYAQTEILKRVEKIIDNSKDDQKEIIAKTNNLMGPECLKVVKILLRRPLQTYRLCLTKKNIFIG